MNNILKRGISAIVATVLMVLIVVVAVGVVWGVLIPLLNTDIEASKNTITIDTTGGYTLYDPVQQIACVSVQRLSKAEIEGLRFTFHFEGDSKTSEINDASDLPKI